MRRQLLSEFGPRPKNEQVYASETVLSLVTLLGAICLFKPHVGILGALSAVGRFGPMIFCGGPVYLIFIPLRIISRRVCT